MRKRYLAAALGLAAVTLAAGARALYPVEASAEREFRIATAASMRPAMEGLVERFRRKTGIEADIVTGPTGQLFAQIVRGAPYNLFMSADFERPARLVEEGRARPASLRVYAKGRLAAWVPGSDCRPDCLERARNARTLSIASPELAPYGAAASKCLSDDYRGRLIRGADVGQSFQFVATGNADAGIVSQSQIRHGVREGHVRESDFSLVPADCHAPVRHALVIPLHNRHLAAAQQFVEWLSSGEARAVLTQSGFELPGRDD